MDGWLDGMDRMDGGGMDAMDGMVWIEWMGEGMDIMDGMVWRDEMDG